MSKTRQIANMVSSGTDARMNIPTFSTTQRDDGSFDAGSVIYNTTSTKLEFYNGTSWQSLPGMTLGLTVALDG
jgi:hypothetical protein|tara:strand:+ start:713 stop:931 length:219 start_codon:yes stop_codon:yes gene_type:complete